ncbi:hypothetical protein [Lysinibacter cavernae]|uniref:hypothetical protein n=1 Tax=Lysinibacter cavernae TaxID=1640652 RepID=UPI003621A8B1
MKYNRSKDNPLAERIEIEAAQAKLAKISAAAQRNPDPNGNPQHDRGLLMYRSEIHQILEEDPALCLKERDEKTWDKATAQVAELLSLESDVLADLLARNPHRGLS